MQTKLLAFRFTLSLCWSCQEWEERKKEKNANKVCPSSLSSHSSLKKKNALSSSQWGKHRIISDSEYILDTPLSSLFLMLNQQLKSTRVLYIECQDSSRTGSTDLWYSSFHICLNISISNIFPNQFY